MANPLQQQLPAPARPIKFKDECPMCGGELRFIVDEADHAVFYCAGQASDIQLNGCGWSASVPHWTRVTSQATLRPTG